MVARLSAVLNRRSRPASLLGRGESLLSVASATQQQEGFVRGINQFFLLGTLHSQPDVLTSRGGKSYVKFELAVTTVRRTDGKDEEQHEIIPLVGFGGIASLLERYVKVNDPVHVSGRIQSFEYESAKGKRRGLSIVAESLNLLPSGRPKGEA
jgi:single-stranded DNA-binding protein